MILHTGGRSRPELERFFRRLARKLREAKPARPMHPHGRAHHRTMTTAIDALAPRIVDAFDRMRAPLAKAVRQVSESAMVLKPDQAREAADPGADERRSVQDILDAADAMSPDDLYEALSSVMGELYASGLEHARSELSVPESSWNAPATRALSALDGYALTFATTVSDDERTAIKAMLADALTQGVSIEDLTGQIRDYMADGVHRIDRNGNLVALDTQTWARTVARTEVARAQNRGLVDAYRTIGIDLVEWVAADDERTCDDCDDLDGEEAELGASFLDSGVDAPPLHPNCRCTLIAVRNADGTPVELDDEDDGAADGDQGGGSPDEGSGE